MDTLVFDEDQARRLAELYSTPDILERRRVALRALAPHPGERVIDIGCGPGYFALDVAQAVGPAGSVVGVDASTDMLAVARHSHSQNLHGRSMELIEGNVLNLPVDDESFDAALCVQVLEYVEDIPAALSEINRVLEPGGRAVVWDTDWLGLAWLAGNTARMRKVLDAWQEHLVHPDLPRWLSGALVTAGFEVEAKGHLIVNLADGPANYSAGLISLIEGFVVGRGGVDQGDVRAWLDDLRDASDAGTYYLACPQVCFTAKKVSAA